MLMLATMLVTAGGYVINDYFDRKIDTVNNPKEVIVGRSVSLRHTMTIHLVLTTLEYCSGYMLPGRQILLFSESCSCSEAVFCGFIRPPINARFYWATLLSPHDGHGPHVGAAFRITLQYRQYGSLLAAGSFNLSYIALWVPAFRVCLHPYPGREIIKDAEDLKGDTSYGRRTLAAIAGMNVSKAVVVFLYTITALSLILIYLVYLPDRFTLIYILVLLMLPWQQLFF